MRALYALAATLGTTVAVLSASLSGQEFTRWVLWMHAERVGPQWQAQRHAELLAAVNNGGQVKRQGGGLFKPSDFLPADPWNPPRPATPEEEAERLQREYDALVQSMEQQA